MQLETALGIRILEPLTPGVEPGLYFCEHEGVTCSPTLSPSPPPAGFQLHSPSSTDSSADCAVQREGAAPGGPAGRTAMSSCREWMQLPVDGSAISKLDDEGQTSCKGWLNQPTSVEEALICDVKRCSEKGVRISYLYADSKSVTPLFAM